MERDRVRIGLTIEEENREDKEEAEEERGDSHLFGRDINDERAFHLKKADEYGLKRYL